MKIYHLLIGMAVFYFACTWGKREVITPTILANGLIKAAFDRDSSYFLERIENQTKLRQTLKLYKDIRPNMREYEQILLSDNTQYNLMKDSAMRMYKSLIDSIQLHGIERIVFDTVDFNNYLNNYRPYYKLDVEGYIFKGHDTLLLKITEAMLLSDGWNLGSVKLIKLRGDYITIRASDSIKEAVKQDPKNIRTMDSLNKINEIRNAYPPIEN